MIFDDTAAGTTFVNVNAIVNPTSVTFNNSLLHYTLSGSGEIASGAAAKNRSGLLTIANTNSYAGGTYIDGRLSPWGPVTRRPSAAALSLGGSGSSGASPGWVQPEIRSSVGAGATAAGQVVTASSGSGTLLFSGGSGASVLAGRSAIQRP